MKGSGGSKTCEACSDATKGGVKGCTKCAPKAGTPDQATCTACTSGKKPNAAGSSCYTCPDEGETAGCSNCSDNGKCEACVSGKILKTSGNTKTCVAEAECTAGFFVSMANSGKTCISCGATPNGVSGCAECQPSTQGSADARCTKCSNSVQKPSEDGRQCNNCNVNGCVNCNAENQCAVCGDGYRHDANTCQKCTPANCKACANDAKICTECVEGYTPSADGSSCASSSANRSGLSTGAIAGISVAAVVVVGGLVGFLCWWFICRGSNTQCDIAA